MTTPHGVAGVDADEQRWAEALVAITEAMGNAP
jgi:hypothetical protein